jgi:nicotinamidase-related amidase
VGLQIESTALLIVDIGNDHVMPDGVNFKYLGKTPISDEGRAKIFSANRALAAAMRDLGRPVIYLHGERRLDGLDYARSEIKNRRDPGWPPGVAVDLAGSWGAQICDEIAPQQGDIVLTKKAHSGFAWTVLDQLLRKLGISTVVATGGGTTGCLADTVRQGAAYGYDMWVVKDAVYPRPGDEMVDTMQTEATITQTGDALDLLKSATH